MKLVFSITTLSLLIVATGCGDKSKTSAKPGDTEQARKDRKPSADRSFSEGDYATAVELYQKRIDKDPTDEEAWFRLGYSLLTQGNLDEAIEALDKSAEFPRFRALSLYNSACAMARNGDKDGSISKLGEAIAAGFANKRTIREDTDLDSLRSDDRFVKLFKEMPEASGTRRAALSDHSELDFWVGRWDVFSDGKSEKRVATSNVTFEHNKFMIHERWDSRSMSGSGVCYYEPSTDSWKQTRISGDGSVGTYVGRPLDKEQAFRFEGKTTSTKGKTRTVRRTLIPNSDGTVTNVTEAQEDDEWKEISRLVYRQKRPRLTIGR